MWFMVQVRYEAKRRITMRIIVATKNNNKVREITDVLSPLGFDVVSQADAGIDIDVEETGDTFEKNALIKARAIALVCDDYVLADDSGLCVEALDGRPGVYSARYAGEDATDKDKYTKLLGELGNTTNRSAKFVTSMAFVTPEGAEIVTSGEVLGKITKEPMGSGGFGYDPVFYSDELEKTFGEASLEEKNTVSHRSRALKALYDILSGEEKD